MNKLIPGTTGLITEEDVKPLLEFAEQLAKWEIGEVPDAFESLELKKFVALRLDDNEFINTQEVRLPKFSDPQNEKKV